MFFEAILLYLTVFLIIFALFGAVMLIAKFVKNNWINRYLLPLVSVIFICFLNFIVEHFHISVYSGDLFKIKYLVLMILTIFPTVWIVGISDEEERKAISSFTLFDFLDGVAMEIPQRLLAQNLFLWGIIIFQIHFGDFTYLAVVLNTILWANLIVVQWKMSHKKWTKKLSCEICASIWFSIFVGILYLLSSNILLPMLCHGLERYFKHRRINLPKFD